MATGLVIKQSPSAGTPEKKGSRVGYRRLGRSGERGARGRRRLARREAPQRLSEAGLTTKVKTEPSKTVASGVVIGTEPPAETELQEGSSVTLLVSSGPAPVRVPDVTGETLEAAEATLTNAELALGA